MPPFLCLATSVEMLCTLSSMVLAGWILVTRLLFGFAAGTIPLLAIMLSLTVLSFDFNFLSYAYRSHVRSPNTRGFPFHSWQHQARITARLAVLPLGAFVLALVGPGEPFAVLSVVVSLVAAANNLFALAWPVDPPA